ncbi:MAG TPA: hypothetical protein VIU12_01035, partial [Chryseolinea sp.]
VYYTGIFCQLVLLGGIVTFVRTRSIPAFISVLCIIAASALAFGLMNLDSWFYRLEHGANSGALVREYKWLEIYGLKIVDLFIPPIVHQWNAFRAFSEHHAGEAVLQDEGSYLGLVGISALLLLAGTSIFAVIRRRSQDIPLEAWQILWIVLFFSTGGLNAFTGLFGFTMFRAACRYSIIILAIALMYSALKLTKLGEKGSVLSMFAAAAMSLIILWDQVPRPPTARETESIARQVASDRSFVSAMEAVLPKNAMVFQIPVMDFPEAPAPGVPPYDHFRPYLYSDHLRFSFGSMKGRPREQWQRDLAKLPLTDAVSQIRNRGFKAIYINRNGFPDKGQGIEETLRSLGHAEVVNSQEGDLVCVIFAPDPLEKPIKLFP